MNTKLKVYVAGPYSRKTELKQHAERLRAEGHVITASWLYRPEVDDGGFGDEQKTLAAAEDFVDIKRADAVLNFTEPPGTVNRRGGRHVELGLALAWGKAVVCVGECEHVFHYLSQIVWCGNVEAAASVLGILACAKRGRVTARGEHPAVSAVNALHLHLEQIAVGMTNRVCDAVRAARDDLSKQL
ncbi:MAG: hypothetical protein LBK60_09100 [Verrucomicrobiales bacterium]|jgi:hypothetical protein|nr:hypothetical protein [Verrucomicrobiales bacterium]